MSQWEYFAEVAYEVGGGDIPFPAEELGEKRKIMSEEDFKEWLKKYRYGFLHYFHFMKDQYGFDIYEEFKKIEKIEEVKLDSIYNRFEILDIR